MHTLAYIWRSAFAPQHIIGVAAVLGILAIVVYARNMRRQPVASVVLLAMRLSIIVGLAILLMGPSVLPPAAPTSARPPLHIYLDTSGSMLTDDVQGQPRIAFALRKWLSDDQLKRLGEQYEVKLFSFDAAIAPLSPLNLKKPIDQLASGKTSLIAQNLRQAVFDLPAAAQGKAGAAMLVLSDGHDSQAEPIAQIASLAKSRNTAIHAVALGGKTLQQDLALSAALQQRFLIAKEPGTITVRVRQTGLEQAATTLHIKQGEQTITRPVTFAGQREMDLQIPIKHDKPGTYEYSLTLDASKGETELGNNARTLFAEVSAERIKVLLLEGEPYWDTKYLAQSLRKDLSIELTHITQMSYTKQSKIVTRGDAASAATLPTKPEDLAKYNVVILGRGMEHILSLEQAKLLPAYVDQGGGNVIFARGQPYDPGSAIGRQIGREWSALEPVVWGQGVMRSLSFVLTPLGKAEPCFAFDAIKVDTEEALRTLEAFKVMPVVDSTKLTAHVLARAIPHGGALSGNADTSPPALVRMQVGAGHTVAVLGEGLWQWGQLPPKLKRFDGMFDTFWSNMVRGLAMGGRFQPNQDVSLELSESNARLGDPVTITIITRTAPKEVFNPTLRVTDPAGKNHEPSLRRLLGDTRMQATFKPEATGVYTVALDAAPLTPAKQEKKFSVFYEDIERLESSADTEAMRALAEQSGGLFFTADQSADLPGQLKRLLEAQMTPNQPHYVWNRGFVLALLLLWIGAEWLARRGAGLI
jgi:hypothetical protein